RKRAWRRLRINRHSDLLSSKRPVSAHRAERRWRKLDADRWASTLSADRMRPFTRRQSYHIAPRFRQVRLREGMDYSAIVEPWGIPRPQLVPGRRPSTQSPSSASTVAAALRITEWAKDRKSTRLN